LKKHKKVTLMHASNCSGPRNLKAIIKNSK